MTKAELVANMAKDAGISKVAASTALDSFMNNVTKSLKKKDGKVTLVGFGTFSKAHRKARKGRNPYQVICAIDDWRRRDVACGCVVMSALGKQCVADADGNDEWHRAMLAYADLPLPHKFPIARLDGVQKSVRGAKVENAVWAERELRGVRGLGTRNIGAELETPARAAL